MITLYTMFPLLAWPVVLQFFVVEGIIPEWFADLSLSSTGLVIFSALVLIITCFFYLEEKRIACSEQESRKNEAFMLKFIGFTAGGIVVASLVSLEIDLRVLAQSYGINLLYNLARILLVLYLVSATRMNAKLRLLGFIPSVLFLVFSGSKGSIVVPLLLLVVLSRNKFKYAASGAFILALLVSAEMINEVHFVRYFDVGLSAYQTAAIYEATGESLTRHHVIAISRFLTQGGGYNPVMEYLDSVAIGSGYNLTPTIVGELMAVPFTLSMLILTALFTYYTCASKILRRRIRHGECYLRANFFIMMGALQSSLLDVFTTAVMFWICIAGIVALREASRATLITPRKLILAS